MVRTINEVDRIAEAIVRYLATRPNASETVDGVAKWWLLKQRFNDSIDQVQSALDLLEQRGSVIKIHLADGKTMYKKSATVSANA